MYIFPILVAALKAQVNEPWWQGQGLSVCVPRSVCPSLQSALGEW